MRAVELPLGKQVILSDTVGFISVLPMQLVAAFRATLEKVLAADLILHPNMRAVSHVGTEEQAQSVARILAGLSVANDVPDDRSRSATDRLPELSNPR